MDDFEFPKWCEEFELTEDTKAALLEQGYNSYKSLRHLDEAKVKNQFGKKLKPAQVSLVVEGVSILHPPEKPASQARKDPPPAGQDPPEIQVEEDDVLSKLKKGDSLTGAQVLDLLRQNTSIGSTFDTAAGQMTDQAAGNTTFLDPFQFGKGRFSSKLRAVPDYVSSLARGDNPTTISLGNMDFVSTSQKKVPHEKLTMAQYMEGAIRMTRDLITEDSANLEQITDYLSYVVQVALFGQSFTWSSVLSYDKVYRREQAAMGFKWGTPSPLLMTSHLLKPTNEGVIKKKAQVTQTKDPKSGKMVCLRYNGHQGCSLRSCNFAHVCRACFEEHPEVSHKSTTTKN